MLQGSNNNDKYKKWIMNKLYKIKNSCESQNHSKFSNDDFLEIYFHLVKIIDTSENKKLEKNLKQELSKIKECCDDDCQCVHRSKTFLEIFDKLITIVEKNYNKVAWNNKIKEKKIFTPYDNESKVLHKEEVKEKVDDTLNNNKIYDNKAYDFSSFKLQLDYDKNFKIDADPSGSIIAQGDEAKPEEEEDDNDDNYNLMDIFAYIYNLGEQNIKPGESVSFDQKPILSTSNDISFQEPSSIVINESGLYNLIYYAQTDEKNIALALYINEKEIEKTCSNTTSYSDTFCSQGLIWVPANELPVTITLRNVNIEKEAIFNESVKTGEVNLSILIRKIS